MDGNSHGPELCPIPKAPTTAELDTNNNNHHINTVSGPMTGTTAMQGTVATTATTATTAPPAMRATVATTATETTVTT